jgi:hypothetical protein
LVVDRGCQINTAGNGRYEMRTITLEEHYATPAFMDGPGRQIKEQAEAVRAHPEVAAGLSRLIDQLCDIGEGRIANMDAAGIDVQVLSLTAPGVEQLDAAEAVPFARVTNDTLCRGGASPSGAACRLRSATDRGTGRSCRRAAAYGRHAWFHRSLDQRSQPRPLPG